MAGVFFLWVHEFALLRQSPLRSLSTRTRVYPSSAFSMVESDISDFDGGEGWGEGANSLDKSYPLTRRTSRADLSLWER
jgi:hypothetical protein